MWKKLLSLFLVFALLVPGASAEGLGGLGSGENAGGGGLSGLLPTEAPNPNFGVVPDAADLTGTARNTLQNNYEFVTGLFFTAYTYAMPGDVAAFTEAYVEEAEKNGFTVEQTTVEGYDARQITWVDGTYALLVPNFGGQVLLLVQNGMTFGKPKPTGYYIEFEYNGEFVQRTVEDRISILHYQLYGLTFSAPKMNLFSITTYEKSGDSVLEFSLNFPDDVRAGNEYRFTSSSYKQGYYLQVKTSRSDYDLLSWYGNHEFKESADYFKLSIISIETVLDRVIIEADFEGRFRYGAVTVTNGHFYMSFPRERIDL